MIPLVLLVPLSLTTLLAYWLLQPKSSKRPRVKIPGPLCLPLLFPLSFPKKNGPNAAEGSRPVYQVFMDWAREFGPAFGFGAFGGRFVVVNGAAEYRRLMREHSEVLRGRLSSGVSSIFNPRHLGLVMSDGRLWSDQRRFSLHALRDLGFGRGGSERIVREEVVHLCAELERLSVIEGSDSDKDTASIDPRLPVVSAVTNVICVHVFSERLADDPKFKEIKRLLCEHIFPINMVNLLSDLIPRIALWLPFDPLGVKRFLRAVAHVKAYVGEQIQAHRQTFDPNNVRDYIDAFLVEQKKRATDDSSTFIAGQETSATALLWALLLVARHPDVQQRVRREIELAIGQREATYADRTQLQYCESVIDEVLRFSTIAPVTVYNLQGGTEHRSDPEVILHTKRVPTRRLSISQHRDCKESGTDGELEYEMEVAPDSVMIMNLYGIHRDPLVWPDPDHFNPDANFPIEPEKHAILKRSRDHMVAFGGGKRACLGESLARQELLLFFVGIMQRFSIKPSSDRPLPSEHISRAGLTRAPLPFWLRFIRV